MFPRHQRDELVRCGVCSIGENDADQHSPSRLARRRTLRSIHPERPKYAGDGLRWQRDKELVPERQVPVGRPVPERRRADAQAEVPALSVIRRPRSRVAPVLLRRDATVEPEPERHVGVGQHAEGRLVRQYDAGQAQDVAGAESVGKGRVRAGGRGASAGETGFPRANSATLFIVGVPGAARSQ